MLRFLIIALMLFAVGPETVFAAAGAQVSYLAGPAFVRYENVDEWVAAEQGMPVTEGDELRTGEGGRLELLLPGGSLARVDQFSSFDMIALDPDLASFYLAAGDIYMQFAGGKRATMEVETPVAELRAGVGSTFGVWQDDDGESLQVRVVHGVISVTVAGRRWTVEPGQKLLVKGREVKIVPSDPPSAWEQWNDDRDQQGRSGR